MTEESAVQSLPATNTHPSLPDYEVTYYRRASMWPIAFLAAITIICLTVYVLLVGAGVVDPNLVRAGVR